MTASSFPGNGLFFDPLARSAAAPARMQDEGPAANSERPQDGMPPRQAPPAPDEIALRAASLRKVSRDLERLLREQGR
jgi:hypothetical protein